MEIYVLVSSDQGLVQAYALKEDADYMAARLSCIASEANEPVQYHVHRVEVQGPQS